MYLASLYGIVLITQTRPTVTQPPDGYIVQNKKGITESNETDKEKP